MELDTAKPLISMILKEYEQESKLDHLVEILVVQESSEKFLLSILEHSSKPELVAKMNGILGSTVLTEDKVTDQIMQLSKENQIKLCHAFLDEFQKSGYLSKLLEGILFKQESPNSSMFAFLLHLAALSDETIVGMEKITKHMQFTAGVCVKLLSKMFSFFEGNDLVVSFEK